LTINGSAGGPAKSKVSRFGDLTAQDFRVWEDGKEQPVRSASFSGH
jgi:hypothetical protein